MVTNWIIIGAILVLIAGVVLAFRSAAIDAPLSGERSGKSDAKGAVSNS